MKRIILLSLLVFQNLIFSQVPDLINCDGNAIFDLTSRETILIGTQNPADIFITYHTTQSDAQNNVNAIANASSYTNISNPQTIYARVENIVSNAVIINNFDLLVNTPIVISNLLTPFTCATNGTISFTISGGSSNYSTTLYLNNVLVATQTGNVISFTNLQAGDYMLQVVDGLGCSTQIQVSLFPINPVTASVIVTGNDCVNGGSILIIASGGSSGYQYSIDSGVTFTSTNSFSGLTPGTYTVIVMDLNGCAYSQVITINQLAPITANVVVNNSTIEISNVTGGSPPYSYSINGGPLQNFQLPFIITGLPVGTICIQISDQNSCFFQECVTITGTINLQANGTYTDYNNDGFVNVGDVIMYDFTVTNTETLDVTSITLDAFGLTNNNTTIATLAGGASDTSTFAATYVLNQNDINTGSVSKNFQVNGTYDGNPTGAFTTKITSLAISDGIKLNAFIDTNNNNIQDNGELNINIGSFEYQLNNGNAVSVVSSSGTHYLYETNSSNSYNLSYVIDPAYAAQYTVSQNNYNNISVITNSGITTYNFPLTRITYVDSQVYLSQIGAPPRPGFTYQNRIVYRNNGNQTITSGTVTFTNSNVVSILNISESGSTFNANGFSYTFTNLLPNQTRYIDVTMQTPTIPAVALGDVVTNSVAITIPSGDVDVVNNEATLSQIIVGSWDPNDKTEIHGGKIVKADFSVDDYLTYTIQFENTGTANAVNVKVEDVLDATLDASTIKMIDASHRYILERNGSNLSWKFNGIDLPPSQVNTTIGKGYIIFQIKPITGYEIGDTIPNTANIYFDFNPAIVTNTFTTEFVNVLITESFKNNSFSVYPNPMNEEVFVTSTNNSLIKSVYLIDVLGKVIYSENSNINTVRLDVSNLQKGAYFLKIKTAESNETVKLIKQ